MSEESQSSTEPGPIDRELLFMQMLAWTLFVFCVMVIFNAF